MFMKWGKDGKESCVQSVPGDGDGWYPVVLARKERFNPATQRVTYEKVENLIVERVVGDSSPTYWQGRMSEYPQLADQIDAIWKGGEEMEAMRQRVLAVKAKWPKP